MRLLFSALAVITAAAAFGAPAAAQNYPWCEILTGKAGGAQNCGFVSYQQCMATAQGTGAFCEPNTQYVPPVARTPATRTKHHKQSNS